MSASPLVVEHAASPSRLPVLRRVFSFPVMLSGLLSVLGVLTVRSRFDDPDMWWHLKTGQIIWTIHRIPTIDVFSYTTGHHAWVPHEWLSQLSIYAAYHVGGYTGLMFWLCLFTVTLFIAGYALCSLYSGNAKVAFIGALAIWFFATAGLAIRPQMIGYLLLIVELLVVHAGRTRDPRWFYWLPPLFALWVNCHGSFFLGIVLGGVFLFCSFFEFQFGALVSRRWDGHRRRIFALSLVFSTAALFLNPVGLKQVLYPLNALFHQTLQLANVQEWMPLAMNGGRGLGVLLVLVGILILVVVNRSLELYWDELILLAMGTWLAVSHQRMVFVFGVLAAPILSRLLAPYWENYDSARDHPLPNAVLIAMSALIAVLGFPSHRNLVRQVDERSPVKAVDFIETHRLSGNMLNDYTYGGYLIWAAPDHPVFVDGRGDVFEWTGVLAEYGKWATMQSDPRTLLEKYRIGFCLLARTSPMARVFPLLSNWKMVYSDRQSVIFVRTSGTAFTKSETTAAN